MPTPYTSRSEFETAFDDLIRGEFAHIRRSYANQQRRKLILLLIALVSALTAMRILFAPLMLVFFAIGFGLYFLLFRNRTKRIKVDEEMRRMLFRRIAKMSNYPSAIHTHQFLSQNSFNASGLFDFKPQKYAGNELIEIGEEHELGLSQIKAQEGEPTDGWLLRFFVKMGWSDAEEGINVFDGWLLKLNRRPDDTRTDWEIGKLNLSNAWSDNLMPNTYFAAGQLGKFYERGATSIQLNRDTIWEFYQLVTLALKP